MTFNKALVWFRRDLRDYDHAALAAALASSRQVLCAFVFDREILDALPGRLDRRVHFIRESLEDLDLALQRRGGGLMVRIGQSREEIPRLAAELGVQAVWAGRDYEPQAKARDAEVARRLEQIDVRFLAVKDQAVFDGDEVLTQAGTPFTVFGPYRNAWLKRLDLHGVHPAQAEGELAPPPRAEPIPELAHIGFQATDLAVLGTLPGISGARRAWEQFQERLSRYALDRNFPAREGVSHLSVHLRFGTLSIREMVAYARQEAALGSEGAATWLGELIWRDFFFMILDRFPRVVGHAFKPAYDALIWEDCPEGLAAWREGRTGYPLVDAGLRQLQRTGYMHNRLRMLTASFLIKDLGIDWRLGERHFADQLNDFDLAANNGNWQWVASTGCDAQPYFRIFNPVTQSKKFDPDGTFIRRQVPELARVPERYIHAPWRMSAASQRDCGVIIGRDYPAPIIEHGAARERTLARYTGVRRGALP